MSQLTTLPVAGTSHRAVSAIAIASSGGLLLLNLWCSALTSSHFCADAKLDLKKFEDKFNSRKIPLLPIWF